MSINSLCDFRGRQETASDKLHCGGVNMNFDCGLAVHSRARTRKLLLAGTALATAILFPSLAQAQVWQDGGVDNGNYNQQSNWSTNTVPDTAGEPGTFANNGTAAVTVTLGPIGPQSWTFAVNSQSYTVTGQAVNLVTGITNNANARRQE